MTDQYTGRSQTLAANSTALSGLVGQAADELRLANRGEKVPLCDLERIRQRTEDYLEDCSQRGTLPTVRGMAARLGVSRQALYDYAQHHPGSGFDLWLKDFSDLCGELTMQAALAGTVQPIAAIFTCKARFGWREPAARVELDAASPLGDLTPTDELMQKYAFLEEESDTYQTQRR